MMVIGGSILSTNIGTKKKKKVLTPFIRLKNRIHKEFPKKKLIGDIIINDSEYEMLIDYFKIKCKIIENSGSHSIKDPIFAVVLVQIGIKYYDGNFWGHVAKVLSMDKISSNFQVWIGESFVKTLSSYNKLLFNKNERVNNILMHGFVSDYYANDMFDFLFRYYDIDLERDLERNNKEMMKNLIEVIQKNDNTGRTYLLVKQTADAININTSGGKIRIRRLLRLIDKCFWEEITPVNPVSRLSILFNKWQENSNEFKLKCNIYNSGSAGEGRKRSYSSPYIKCDFQNTTFKIILPTQLVKFDFEKDVKWNIYTQDKRTTIDTYLYEAVTGYKTETQIISINREDIFNEFIIELTCDEKRIKLFKIKSDCIRFFDREGNYLNSDNNLPKGDVFAFTKENETPISEALLETEPIGKLVRSYFEFEHGDIIRLPDGKSISIGKKIEEGLLYRKILKDSYAKNGDYIIPVYYAPPTMLIKMPEKKAIGTAIQINDNRYRMFDKQTTIIELGDRSGEVGYVINLKDYGCNKDGIYNIFVDVPNDRTNRSWQFALINGMSYEFEDAPYIFKTRGTISFNEELSVYTKNSSVIKNTDENSYNFKINENDDYLGFYYKSKEQNIHLQFFIPVLKWSFDEKNWHIEKPTDIWHSDFPYHIYFKYPDDKLRISMDELIGHEDDMTEQSVTYYKSKIKGYFECDTTRFISWFGREKIKRIVFIEFVKKRIEFLNIVTRSVVVEHVLKGDFESEKLIGEFEIIGRAKYYADIVLLGTNEILSKKLPIIDGKFVLESKLNSGKYKIIVYEDEEDDTGFGISNYLPIGEFIHKIINPYDLTGKNIAIKSIKKAENNIFQVKLSCDYVICNLTRVDENDRNNYKGKLLIRYFTGSPIAYDVNVEFFNLNKLQYVYITYFDGYDFVEFLHDTFKNIIVKEEEKGLKRAVRYRRYESLFPEDYIYVVEFTDDTPKINEKVAYSTNKSYKNKMIWKQNSENRDITIENMELSVRTYNCLNRARIKTPNEIQLRGIDGLFKVRNLGKSGIVEIISKMRELGFDIGDIENSQTTSKVENR